jgi:hypothetical protein
MVAFRFAIFVLLAAAGICFVLFAATGNPIWKRRGGLILKWTMISAFGFFAVLAVQRFG